MGGTTYKTWKRFGVWIHLSNRGGVGEFMFAIADSHGDETMLDN